MPDDHTTNRDYYYNPEARNLTHKFDLLITIGNLHNEKKNLVYKHLFIKKPGINNIMTVALRTSLFHYNINKDTILCSLYSIIN